MSEKNRPTAPPPWMQGMPAEWDDLRLKDVAHAPRTKPKTAPALYVGLEHVEPQMGIATPVPLDEETSTYKIVAKGTICFGKLRPYLAKAFEAEQTLAVSTEFLPMVSNGRMLPKYLRLLLISKGFIDHLSDEVAGAKMPRIDWGILSSRRLPAPPLAEQRWILDEIEEKLSGLDLQARTLAQRQDVLDELKSALREEILLERPARAAAEGRWFGNERPGWSVDRIGNLFRQPKEKGGKDLPILSVSIHTGISDRELSNDEQERKVNRSENRSLYKRVRPGDIVYNQMRAWQGGFGVAKVDGLVSPAYVVARPRREVEPRFVEHLLRTKSGIEEMRRRSRGIIDFRLRLYWEEFKDILVALPSQREQGRLSDELDRRLASLNAQEAAMEEMWAVLREQRKAIIHEYLSGKRRAKAGCPNSAVAELSA